MRLQELLSGIEYKGIIEDTEITEVTYDSRRAKPGCVFVCAKGSKADGHDFAAQAAEMGASAIVCERSVGVKNELIVGCSRSVYARMCAALNGNPAEKLKLIGITGTNGKTTITYLIKHLLEHAGKRVGLIGTISNNIVGMELPAKHTTPDPGELHLLFSKMLSAGCEYVVMEVSSHALDQHRLDGVTFDVGVFTNLTQDHLDYHGTMDNYFEAKKKLFSSSKQAVLNLDCPYGERLSKELSIPVITYSASDDGATYTAHNVSLSAKGAGFVLVGNGVIGRVKFPMPGQYSVSNALAAAGAALAAGVDFDCVVEGLNSCPGVKGRTEVLPTGTDYTVICDYAHSPDSLEKVVDTVGAFAKGRVITLFGCAGNRDAKKRPLMAKAVAKRSDYIVFTSDNPRNEDPLKIIEDAMSGFDGYNGVLKVIPDRYEAIKHALSIAEPEDVIILAGKGHEDYQVLREGTIYFDEHVIVKEILGISENEK